MRNFYLALSAILIISAFVVSGIGISTTQHTEPEQIKPAKMATKVWYGEATTVLEADAIGCKVYEIERSNCWIYVNNQGGIAVIEK